MTLPNTPAQDKLIREADDGEAIYPAPFVYRFIGPLAIHNYLCPVCRETFAVLDCNKGVLHPCWKCRKNGWITLKPKTKFASFILRFFFAEVSFYAY